MIVTLNLSPEMARRLRDRATLGGQTLEGYLYQLVEQDAQTLHENGSSPTDQPLSAADFDHWLDELSAGLGPLSSLPAHWSRADVYGEHD